MISFAALGCLQNSRILSCPVTCPATCPVTSLRIEVGSTSTSLDCSKKNSLGKKVIITEPGCSSHKGASMLQSILLKVQFLMGNFCDRSRARIFTPERLILYPLRSQQPMQGGMKGCSFGGCRPIFMAKLKRLSFVRC